MKVVTTVILISISILSISQKISLKDIWIDYKYYNGHLPSIQWRDNDAKMLQSGTKKDKSNCILIYESESGNLIDTLFGSSNHPIVQFSDYIQSPDNQYLLLKTNSQPLYRRSSKASYLLFNLTTQKLDTINATHPQFNPRFSPNSKLIAYTSENNLFTYDIATKIKTQITTDGKWNKIINGRSDWVYEEEFEFTRAFDWSPNSQYIAYLKFDEKGVKTYNMQVWNDSLYPTTHSFKYPKAGEKNSHVSVHCYHLTSQTNQIIYNNVSEDYYLPRISFTNQSTTISITKMNREQNILDLLHIRISDNKIITAYHETSSTYIELPEIHYLKDNQLTISSEKSGFNHLYLLDYKTNILKPITSGNWEIDDILGYDTTKQLVYYNSTEISSLERQIYSSTLDGKNKTKLTNLPGINDGELSTKGNYIIRHHSSITSSPSVSLLKTTGTSIRTMMSNTRVQSAINQLDITPPEFFTIKSEDGQLLNAYMIKPPSMKKKKKLPVLVYVYGGPGAQTVQNSWGYFNYLWHQLLAQKGYIVVSMDGRGTGGKGAAFRKQTYENLGQKETADLISLAKYLGEQPYIDKDRIGLWGWSFGGYLTSLGLTKGAPYFKVGIAIAPVTTWRFYDTIYTERYLKTPQNNSSGYDNNSPLNFAHLMTGDFLLVHGSADDNVHYQNSMAFEAALINNNIQFRSFTYPDKNHGIYGGITRYHLYKMMTDFLEEKL